MSNTMVKLIVIFQTDKQEEIQYTFHRVKQNLTKDEISTFVNKLITLKAIKTDKGIITKAISAKTLSEDTTEFSFIMDKEN